MQKKQGEWFDQWSRFSDEARFLFEDWIRPLGMADFQGKSVLEAGCGGGMHTAWIAPVAKEMVAVDLNCTAIARERCKGFSNVRFVQDDLATMDLGRKFDIVLSVGVIHHTDDPDKSFTNLLRHTEPGGKLVVWVYSREGNRLVEYGVEPIRKLFLRYLPKDILFGISLAVTALLYIPVQTIYRMPMRAMPFFEYFQNFRRLTFRKNLTNVFDKLNAPQVQFIDQSRIRSWFATGFSQVVINPYCGVSWTGFGVVRT